MNLRKKSKRTIYLSTYLFVTVIISIEMEKSRSASFVIFLFFLLLITSLFTSCHARIGEYWHHPWWPLLPRFHPHWFANIPPTVPFNPLPPSPPKLDVPSSPPPTPIMQPAPPPHLIMSSRLPQTPSVPPTPPSTPTIPFSPPSIPIKPPTPPSHPLARTPSPKTFNVLIYGAKGDGKTDDTKAFLDTWSAACAVKASTFVVPARFHFLVGPITFEGDSCKPNTIFQVDGTLVAHKQGSKAWGKKRVSEWILFKKVKRLTIRGSGTIDGKGSLWWDGLSNIEDIPMEVRDNGEDIPTEGSIQRIEATNRPTALKVHHSSDITVTGITIKNSPKFHLTFDTCHDVEVYDVAVSSPGKSPNTDGIHLARCIRVSIRHVNLACGDDCISIQHGCKDVSIRNVKCGPGHGISIGGLGKSNSHAVVSNVSVHDVIFTQTMTGVRIKTWQGGSGNVQDIRFKDIQMEEVKIPIMIDQYYCDHTTCTNQTEAVAVSGVTYKGIIGTYTHWPVYLSCSDSTPCSGLRLSNIKLAPVTEKHHQYDPFCWQAYGHKASPIQPPVDCLLARKP